MSLSVDFWEQLSSKTDAELYDMLAHQDDYLAEALVAARDELKKRNLAPEKVAQIEAEVESEKIAAEAKAQQRLSWPARILIFLFCGGLAGIALAFYYEIKGYKRKATDCWITVAVSVGVHVFIGFAAFLAR